MVVPLPSWPDAFSPVAHSERSSLRANDWFPPAAIPITPVATTTGEMREVVVPSPSWPDALYPTARRVPSALRNMLWLSAVAAATIPSAILIGVL